MSSEYLAQTLANLPSQSLFQDRLLTSLTTNEDAAVVTIPEGSALVQTVDFFTPIVNDPYSFGKIAAANALSDVYVMGGAPWCAMNIVMFPTDVYPKELLSEILRGGGDTLIEAGAALVGGHSIDDTDIKYGLSVTGIISPHCIATNNKLQEGDILILTKALGTGILVTALKNEMEKSAQYEKTLIASSSKLNRGAGMAIQECSLQAATDITGFGLGGHSIEMAKASNVCIELTTSSLPYLDGVHSLLTQGIYPGGSKENMLYAQGDTHILPSADPIAVQLAFDAQTSGGALLAVAEEKIEKVSKVLAKYEDVAYIVGRVTKKKDNVSLVLL
ncbi:MAG: selenide, water dikinase SelD [Desulfovibrionaceae bacterium]